MGLGSALIANGQPETGIGLIVGGLGGFLVTPDADHNVVTIEEKRWKSIPIVGPYMLETFAGYGAKHKHRGRSHWPIWGTASRIWYFGRRFAADFLLLAYVVGVVFGGGTLDGSILVDVADHLPGFEFFAWGFVAWSVQDTIHILTDLVWSDVKRAKKNRRGSKKWTGKRSDW